MNVFKKGFSKSFKDELDIAQTYYAMFSAFNQLELTQREIELLAFTDLKGTISTKPAKDEFVSFFKSSPATLNNLISHLQRKKLLIKDSNYKIRVNSKIKMDYTKDKFILLFQLQKPEKNES